MAFTVRGVTLPDREEQTFLIDGDRLRTEADTGADLLSDGGWILPGLADLHTHPGTGFPTDTFTEETFVSDLGRHRDAGVLVVRVPGSTVRLGEQQEARAALLRISGPRHFGRGDDGWKRPCYFLRLKSTDTTFEPSSAAFTAGPSFSASSIISGSSAPTSAWKRSSKLTAGSWKPVIAE